MNYVALAGLLHSVLCFFCVICSTCKFYIRARASLWHTYTLLLLSDAATFCHVLTLQLRVSVSFTSAAAQLPFYYCQFTFDAFSMRLQCYRLQMGWIIVAQPMLKLMSAPVRHAANKQALLWHVPHVAAVLFCEEFSELCRQRFIIKRLSIVGRCWSISALCGTAGNMLLQCFKFSSSHCIHMWAAGMLAHIDIDTLLSQIGNSFVAAYVCSKKSGKYFD